MTQPSHPLIQDLINRLTGPRVTPKTGYTRLLYTKRSYLQRSLTKAWHKTLSTTDPLKAEKALNLTHQFLTTYIAPTGAIHTHKASATTYETIYLGNRDVALYWRTRMLYYAKTEPQPRTIEVWLSDNRRIIFDTTEIPHPKAWEKTAHTYKLHQIQPDGTIVIRVVRGRQRPTLNNIIEKLREHGITIHPEELHEAVRTFERQSGKDVFIHKNLRKFLNEQLTLWINQQILTFHQQIDHTLLQLTVNLAKSFIDAIARIEEEVLRIWRKPKFALNSNYVITLDSILGKPGGSKIVEKIIENLKKQLPHFREQLPKLKPLRSIRSIYKRFTMAWPIDDQISEWYLLGLVDEDFSPEELIASEHYRRLPIDTRYFKQLEPEILSLIDHLDREIRGRLIKSENWQALNTLLPRLRGRVQLIYIDPPFNTGTNEFTPYINRFLNTTWITMMENRLTLAKDLLSEEGSIMVRIDYHGNHYTRLLLDQIFGPDHFINEIIVKRSNYQGANAKRRFNPAHETLYFYARNPDKLYFNPPSKPRNREPRWINAVSPKENKKKTTVTIQGRVFVAPRGNHWRFSQRKMEQLLREGRLRIIDDYEYIDVYGEKRRGMIQYLESPETPVDTLFTDIPGYTFTTGFPTENSEQLLKRIIKATTRPDDLVMDFFLGSATTTAVAHKLGRRWIGVEMGQHFYTASLPRMKLVLAYDPHGISKDPDVRKEYNPESPGGIIKYYELEQFEDTLARALYQPTPEWLPENDDPYTLDTKLAYASKIDPETGEPLLDPDKLYPNIDLAETLSNLTGIPVKRIHGNTVEFEDGTTIDARHPPLELFKPLVWWS